MSKRESFNKRAQQICVQPYFQWVICRRLHAGMPEGKAGVPSLAGVAERSSRTDMEMSAASN